MSGYGWAITNKEVTYGEGLDGDSDERLDGIMSEIP